MRHRLARHQQNDQPGGEMGRATLKGKAGKDGSWVIRYAGDTAHFNSTAVADFVDVR
ncbi:hypothetical protein OG741_18415 [Streptomyces sp. NBC_01410]|uniref:hypothetical protein n=1 Tax=Streptomyces sp. NBC_01410 TaxID=2903856 RepID=UPI0032519CB1